MSTYEQDIRRALKDELDSGCLTEIGLADDIFGLLRKAYPSSGSKIDWRRVPGAIECTDRDGSEQTARFLGFFDEMCGRFELSGPVIYVGDSATEFALAGSLETIRRVSPVLIEVPQHHYFVGPNASWCICLTMENDLDFATSDMPPFS
ncbi:hypothetical protein QA649_28835 [Bradyrhizobium sp. CB1717]|uniref:hypothetical protein n=1 Tax=Bradyrhizobium sp. CB1717 TaxID=3039154 RepID=UPI0024B0FDCE|nr:hypothetical protein [Bradyrhizobium sp. CB1717]WFU22087.1 hypothetical protein QA649_28835 [Bradyrhizobium sp. CB1717]